MTRMLTSFLLIELLGTISVAQALPQRFTAFAVSIGGPRTNAVATRVEISISR